MKLARGQEGSQTHAHRTRGGTSSEGRRKAPKQAASQVELPGVPAPVPLLGGACWRRVGGTQTALGGWLLRVLS